MMSRPWGYVGGNGGVVGAQWGGLQPPTILSGQSIDIVTATGGSACETILCINGKAALIQSKNSC